MGRLRLDGAGAAAFLDRLLTRKVVDMAPGKIRYSLVCNESGGILDDVLVYHLQEHGGGLYHLLVVNASNREKIVGWLQVALAAERRRAADRPHDRNGDDRRARAGGAAMRASRSSEPISAGSATTRALETTICGHAGIVSRTGYTGEDGCELIVPRGSARRGLGDGARRGQATPARWPLRPRRSRHAAAGSGDAAVWPRAERSRSIRFRPGLASR